MDGCETRRKRKRRKRRRDDRAEEHRSITVGVNSDEMIVIIKSLNWIFGGMKDDDVSQDVG